MICKKLSSRIAVMITLLLIRNPEIISWVLPVDGLNSRLRRAISCSISDEIQGSWSLRTPFFLDLRMPVKNVFIERAPVTPDIAHFWETIRRAPRGVF